MNHHARPEYDTLDCLLMAAIVFLSAVTFVLLLPVVPGWYLAVIRVHQWPWWAWLVISVTTGVVSMWLRARQEQ